MKATNFQLSGYDPVQNCCVLCPFQGEELLVLASNTLYQWMLHSAVAFKLGLDHAGGLFEDVLLETRIDEALVATADTHTQHDGPQMRTERHPARFNINGRLS